MLYSLYRLTHASNQAAVLEMSKACAHHLGMTPNRWVKLSVGERRTAVQIRIAHKAQENELSLSGSVLSALQLDSPTAMKFRYRIQSKSPNELAMGPVIGILIGHSRDQIRQNRHGYKFFHTFWDIHNIGGLAFYFTLADINWEKRTIFGHVHFPNRSMEIRSPKHVQFETGEFPFPQAVYRRSYVPRETLQHLRNDMTPFIFNDPLCYYRLAQIEALQAIPHLAKHLPETVPLSAESLDQMLVRHQTVYVKASGMGAGRSVFRIARASEGGYVVRTRVSTTSDQEKQIRINSYRQLTRVLAQVRGTFSPSRWSIQQAIRPARWKQRPFDLRITVQKNGLGEWVVNGAYARLAPAPDSIITRLGEYWQAEALLAKRWPISGKRILSTVTDFALACARAFDLKFDYLGDLGVDVLLDEQARPWFLEANAAPGYRPVDKNDQDYWRQLSAPLTYASYLSGFPVYPSH